MRSRHISKVAQGNMVGAHEDETFEEGVCGPVTKNKAICQGECFRVITHINDFHYALGLGMGVITDDEQNSDGDQSRDHAQAPHHTAPAVNFGEVSNRAGAKQVAGIAEGDES